MPSRRAVLGTFGALAACGLAGCIGDGGTGEHPSRTPGTSDGTPNESTPRTGSPEGSPAGTPPTPEGAAVRWVRDLGGSVRHPPAVHDGTLYVGGGRNDGGTPPGNRPHLRPSHAENVYALDPGTGETRWRFEAPAGVSGRPRVVAGGVHVVVGWNAGTHGIDQRLVRLVDGERRWTTDETDRYLSVLGAADGTTFVGTGDDALGFSGESTRAVGRDGAERWRIDSGDAYEGTVHDGTLYVPYGGRRTTALDTTSGEERWSRGMRAAGGDLRVYGDAVYLRADEQDADGDYPLVAADASTGEERWRHAAEGGDEGPFVPTGAVEGEVVYGTEYGGLLFALDPETGEELWRYPVDAETRDPPALAGGTVYLPTLDGRVHAVTPSGERRWVRSAGAHVTNLHANEAGVVVATRGPGGTPYGLSAFAHDGTERWSFAHPGDLTRAVVIGTRAYVGTEGGRVVALG